VKKKKCEVVCRKGWRVRVKWFVVEILLESLIVPYVFRTKKLIHLLWTIKNVWLVSGLANDMSS
jgi:hypothetical protein